MSALNWSKERPACFAARKAAKNSRTGCGRRAALRLAQTCPLPRHDLERRQAALPHTRHRQSRSAAQRRQAVLLVVCFLSSLITFMTFLVAPKPGVGRRTTRPPKFLAATEARGAKGVARRSAHNPMARALRARGAPRRASCDDFQCQSRFRPRCPAAVLSSRWGSSSPRSSPSREATAGVWSSRP